MSSRFLFSWLVLGALSCSGGNGGTGTMDDMDTDQRLPDQFVTGDLADLAPEGTSWDQRSDSEFRDDATPTDVSTDDQSPDEDAVVPDIQSDTPDVVEMDAQEELAEPVWQEVPNTLLADGFHVPVVAPEAGEPFSVIMASDPQVWWNFIDSAGGFSAEEIEHQNLLHIQAMNLLAAVQHLPEGTTPPMAVVMNGDLTEYGRWRQWDAYVRLYSQLTLPIFEGLGNHDIQNNNALVSDGCGMDVVEWNEWSEACQAGSTQTLWGQSACQVADNIQELWTWCASDAMRRMRYWISTRTDVLFDEAPGSASYSWEWGDYHFVQLHNEVGFEVPGTGICSNIPWLKKDLHSAFLRDKKIVINMHKPNTSLLAPLLKGYQYNVVGIFFGHVHERAGYTGPVVVEGISIPKFYCGSVQWNLFAIAQFEPDRLKVTVIDSHGGIPKHHASAAGYVGIGTAFAAAPHVSVFPVNPCPVGQLPAGEDGECQPFQPDIPEPTLCFDP